MNKIANSKIAIIILVWNDYKNTRATIESVLRTKKMDYDIFVVDNASTDGCIDRLKNDFSSFSNIYYIINDCNWGYAEGNNIAIRKCKDLGYEFFFVLNNDVVFDSGECICDMWKAMKEDSNIGIVAPLIWNKQQDGSFGLSPLIPNSRLYLLMMRLNGIKVEIENDKCYVPGVSGCFLAFSKKCIETMAGFEKNFFMYVEEDDLCIRSNLSGLKVVKLSKDYGIKHLGGLSVFEKASDWKRVISYRNRMMLIRNFSVPQRLLFSLIIFLQGCKNTIKLLRIGKYKSAIVYSLAFYEGLFSLCFFKKLSKTAFLYNRGRNIAQSNRIYGIKIK